MWIIYVQKNSSWYKIEKDISKQNEYRGYSMYEIIIPKELFTTSLYPNGKNRVLKITKNNIKEYKKLKLSDNFYSILTGRNIIGVDVTSKFIYKHISVDGTINPPEAFIWQKPSQIKIKKIETVTY